MSKDEPITEENSINIDDYPTYFITAENLVFQKVGFSLSVGATYQIDVSTSKQAKADIRLIEYYCGKTFRLSHDEIKALVLSNVDHLIVDSEINHKPIAPEALITIGIAHYESETIRSAAKPVQADSEGTPETTKE